MNELMLILGMSYNVDECFIKCSNIVKYYIRESNGTYLNQQLHNYQHNGDIIWTYETEFSKQLKAYQSKNYPYHSPNLQAQQQYLGLQSGAAMQQQAVQQYQGTIYNGNLQQWSLGSTGSLSGSITTGDPLSKSLLDHIKGFLK